MIIPARFNGPPQSANGGFACGTLASAMLSGGDGRGVAIEVTLRSPPPLEREMRVDRVATDGAELVRALDGEKLVAEARRVELAVDVPRAPTLEEAREASARFPARERHPYPTCFVCGPRRARGDGLRVHPGAVEGRTIAAAELELDASLPNEGGVVRPEIVWAALDCPSWFGFRCFDDFDGNVLLGRLTARIEGRPRVGDRCIATGWALGRDGRKIRCASTLFTAEGEVLASAEALWILPR